ncbi:DUF4468 domain-containing protein [Myroides marinus]|uniref:DUF4468 domain-containing protein n=1 Tax=Myroides TaxID=76831 RepID=UPI0025776BC7|nr:DUF4468 domain-containing protein [Myroides marinus]MDM1378175.1 DUF4468 domain-containing protein [Myroides marinus]MDM1385439.1 DUF4468 domain-containing protein [Myroides marinus]MDM1392652.1 DUF4468 domain-containing protein [Myroides marinus]
MFKKLLLTIMVLLPVVASAQEPKASLTIDGVAPVIYNAEGKSSSEIYSKVIEWINLKYNSPKDVLKGDIKDKFVSLNGFMDNAWSYSTMGIRTTYGITYKLDIDIKENKYRVTLTLKDFTHPTQKVWYDYHSLFKKDGTIRKVYVEGHKELEDSINNILQDLNNQVNNINTRDDEW